MISLMFLNASLTTVIDLNSLNVKAYMALVLIAVIIGAKKGFLTKTVSLANSLFGLLFALAFSSTFANKVLCNWFGVALQNKIYNNVYTNQGLATCSTNEEVIAKLKENGIPEFLAKIASSNISGEDIASQVATSISSIITSVLLFIIAFIILFFGTTLICLILKGFIKLLRENKFIRVIDGIFGIVLYLCLLALVLEIVFFVLLLLNNYSGLEGYKEFVANDILSDRAFNISKWFFTNNVLNFLIGLIF